MTEKRVKRELLKTPGVSYHSMGTTISLAAIKRDGGTRFLNEICRIVELAALSHLRMEQMATGESGITSKAGELAVVTVSIMAKFDADDSFRTATPEST